MRRMATRSHLKTHECATSTSVEGHTSSCIEVPNGVWASIAEFWSVFTLTADVVARGFPPRCTNVAELGRRSAHSVTVAIRIISLLATALSLPILELKVTRQNLSWNPASELGFRERGGALNYQIFNTRPPTEQLPSFEYADHIT